VATVLKEKYKDFSTNFSKPILPMFYQVILMMEILEQLFHCFYWRLNKTTWLTSKRD